MEKWNKVNFSKDNSVIINIVCEKDDSIAILVKRGKDTVPNMCRVCRADYFYVNEIKSKTVSAKGGIANRQCIHAKELSLYISASKNVQ